jgi:predicted Holliday junction resolvase-like endonuclease
MALTALTILAGMVAGLLAGWTLLRGRIARSARSRLEQRQLDIVERRTEASLVRSRAVLLGQMVEHVVPLSDQFPFDHMADARFLGKPVDFIVFDGYTEAKEGQIDRLREIVFIDVKTGRSRLSAVERGVRACVEAGRVRLVVVDRWRANGAPGDRRSPQRPGRP